MGCQGDPHTLTDGRKSRASVCWPLGSSRKSPKGMANALQAPPRSGDTTPGSDPYAGAMMSARPMTTDAVVGRVALPRPAWEHSKSVQI